MGLSIFHASHSPHPASHAATRRRPGDGRAGSANIKEVLDSLSAKFPNIVGRIFDNGQLRRFVNIYLNDEDIRYLDNLQSPVKDGDVLSIIPAVAGG